MRRVVGLILVGLGACLLVAAPLMRTYAYGRLAVLPTDQYSVNRLVDTGGQVFDPATLQVRDTTVTATSTVRGRVEDSTDDVAVWDNFTVVQTDYGAQISHTQRRVALDRQTAEAVNCCGEFVNDDRAVRHKGWVFSFPFFTEKKEYPFWDSTLKGTAPFRYERTETVQGVRTYRFVQTIPATKTEDVEVPASVLNLPEEEAGGSGTVTAGRYSKVTRVYNVEPTTGAPIRVQEQQFQTLRTADGQDRLVVADLDLRSTDESIRDAIANIRDDMSGLKLIRNTLPLVLMVVGLVFLVAGILLALPGRRREYVDDREPQHARA